MQHFEHELDALKQDLLTMGGKAKAAVVNAMRALVDRNDALAEQVQQADQSLDQMEVDLDEQAVALLSKAPMATQLRLITVAMKINTNLERIGDEATTIARRALELNHEPQLKPYVDLPRMASMALEMIDDALDAFVHQDSVKAAAVVPRDKQVDELNRQLHRELSSFMIERPNTITRCLNLMVISKCLERVADHATNVAEETFYLYEGKDIRHPHRQSPTTT
jgi:phosphate transport system protein